MCIPFANGNDNGMLLTSSIDKLTAFCQCNRRHDLFDKTKKLESSFKAP